MQQAIRLILSATVPFLISCGTACAQGALDTFPSKPIAMVVPYDPGGAVDLECRMYSAKLSSALGQQVIIEYKPGGGTTVGIGYVAKSRPDGYSIVAVSTGLTVIPAFYKDLPFDVSKDLAPISLMSKQISSLQVHPAFPAKNLTEYIAYAKANPGKINYGTAGPGSISHLAGAWLHSLSGTQATFIPHKGTGPLLLELMAGRIDAGTGLLVATMPMIKAGKVRPLAVLGDQRAGLLPDLPTAAEQGITGYNYSSWIGFLAAGGTPAPIVNKLSEAFARVVKLPEIVAELDKQSSIAVGSTPAQFRQWIAVELVRWRKVVDDAGLKLE